jgi:hypothetical protein
VNIYVLYFWYSSPNGYEVVSHGIFLVVLEFELRASGLQRRSSTIQGTPPALFCIEYFQD